jgi:putative membrane-bound dehydrogenase-like protein
MQRFVGLTSLACSVALTFSVAHAEGIRPTAADGRLLNLNLEDGSLKDWTPTGDAFTKQPVEGDTIVKRRPGMKSGHAGNFWLGGYEFLGDDAKGSLTSVPFKVTHRWASFLIAGGAWPTTRVELIDGAEGTSFFNCRGYEHETLRPVVVDLEKQLGKDMYIRIIDEQTGHWGHLNFDEFLFHAERPKFENELHPRDAEKMRTAPDVVKYAGLSPAEAVKAMTLPPGFSATVFAAEPDVVQPVAFTIDPRGRLWVVECLTYPQRAPEGQGKDRILIFEDVDGDGKSDKKTVFAENLNLATGIELGFGGVYVGAAPYLLFIPDRNGDDKPDGAPEVLLDGWGFQDTHETLNSFTWGPDGWLYGCHGIFTHSKVGTPGTPDEKRVKINAGIWRFHPTKKTFELFAEGTSNPWGIDFDANGQLWAEACVVPHLWHVIQGARYQRQAGQHFNPHTYDDIKQSADHVHWAGAAGPHAANNRSDSAGGGHAHAGLMVYNGDAWPEEYRGKFFIGNIHGQRINMDVPKPRGSGYVAAHGADFLNFNDSWSQIINFKSGPDGNVYLIDWYDAEQCHRPDPKAHDRGNGRIYKVSFGESKSKPINLSKASDQELVATQFHDNAWHVTTSRRLLQERAAIGNKPVEAARDLLGVYGASHSESQERLLRAMWGAWAAGVLDQNLLIERSMDFMWEVSKKPHAVGWMFRLLLENRPALDDLRDQAFFSSMARQKKAPATFRLYLASALQRMTFDDRMSWLDALLAREENAADHNLPLMYWYAAEPLAATDSEWAMKLALDSKVPPMLEFMTRRISSIGDEKSLALVTKSLDGIAEDARRLEMLRGLSAAFVGQRDVATPPGWDAVAEKLSHSQNAEVRSLAETLSVTFGSQIALERMRKTLADANATIEQRTAAIDALVRAKDAKSATILQSTAGEPALAGAALRALAAFEDPKTPDAILAIYPKLPVAEKRDALNTLASRPTYAKALLRAVSDKTIPDTDLTPELIRQIREFIDVKELPADHPLSKRLTEEVSVSSNTEKLARIAEVKKMLTTGPKGDAAQGRAVFARTCQQCHILFDAGGDVGPNITGANRADLDYLLLNILDPNAVIPDEYKTTVLRTKDGRVLSGVVRKQDDTSLTLATANETVVVPKKDISRSKVQPVSMMPEGLIDALSETERRDLIAYLQSAKQVPIPATPENAKTFFNGKDLTGWWGHPDIWKVDNGELVGKSEKGLPNNEFLKSNLLVKDFRLTFKMKLTPNTENSGVQIRSVPVENSHEMKGYQCDAGKTWWGKIYHESGRGLLTKVDGDKFVKENDWNTYEILAVGHKIKTAINGKLCSDLDDPDGELEGIIGVQVHAGGPIEVRWKDFELEVNPKPEMKTVK